MLIILSSRYRLMPFIHSSGCIFPSYHGTSGTSIILRIMVPVQKNVNLFFLHFSLYTNITPSLTKLRMIFPKLSDNTYVLTLRNAG
jgi:hypothetical protein